MTETTFKVQLGELNTVRVICKGCGTVVEMPIEKLGKLDSGQCVGCHQGFAASPPIEGQPGRLSKLQQAMQDCADSAVRYKIEFTIPVAGGATH
jgi:hypothetical protein